MSVIRECTFPMCACEIHCDSDEIYNVAYDAPDGMRLYCTFNMTHDEAERQLKAFKSLYLDENGNGKEYPNKRGFYPFRNPRIVKPAIDLN